MAEILGQELGRSRSGWRGGSLRDAFAAQDSDVFRSRREDDEEEELRWAAIERLPTYDRMRKGMLMRAMAEGEKGKREEVDLGRLGMQDRKQLMESVLRVVEEDNERFLRRIRDRTDRVGVEIPRTEVRFEHLSVEADAYVGSRALPTLFNSLLNNLEAILKLFRLAPSNKTINKIRGGGKNNLRGAMAPPTFSSPHIKINLAPPPI